MSILDLRLTEEQEIIMSECEESLAKYNQAAILLSMGGGKSIIAAHLIRRVYSKADKVNILWITTANDVNKAIHIMHNCDFGFESNIEYVTFTKLQRYIDYGNFLVNNKKKFDLIVIDEAHHALAPKTSKGIYNILNNYLGAKLLVMTATKRRYSDRKHIFNELTPKLVLGKDYNDRGLKYAVDNNLTCDFVYKTCNIQMLRDYCKALGALREYSAVYKQYDSLIDKTRRIIEDYSSNIFTKLGEHIRQDLEFDGSEGDRWFVFYNWIDELKENIDSIRETFTVAYDNPDININIIEYHSEIKDKDVMDKILCEPIPNQVDIILTCNRGAESLHPKNTRGIVMLRKTLSNNLFEQMLGRALEIKEACNYVKYIYDCVDNRSGISKNESIYNGLDNVDERRISKLFKDISRNDSILTNLQKKYGDTFDVEMMDSDMAQILDEFNNIKDIFDDIRIAGNIHEIFACRTNGKEEFKDINRFGIFLPKAVLTKFDTEYNTKYAKYFYNIQKKFMSGIYGEHYADEPVVEDAFNCLYNMFGDILYITGDSAENGNIKFTELLDIAREVKRFNYDYKNSISRTKELKRKIAMLRTANLKGNISEAYKVFCNRNKIDINGIYSNLIKEVLESEESEKYSTIKNQFKTLSRDLSTIKNILDNGEYTKSFILDNNLYDKLITVIAREHVFTFIYCNNEYGVQASTALNITYKKVLNLAKLFIDREDYDKASYIIRSLRKIDIFNKSNDDVEVILRNISVDIEYPIIDLVKRNEVNDVSEYELYVLESLGVRVLNTERKDTNIKKLLDKTPFGITYNRFIATSSPEDYRKLQTYKIEGLPQYAKKLLNKKVYKESREAVENEKILSKENKDIEDIVRKLYYVDEEDVNIIKEAIKNREVDKRKIIKYAIPNNVYLNNKPYFDKALVIPWCNLDSKTKNVISYGLSQTTACYDCIIENLIEAKLIPDEQMELACELISIANR